jgi:hypothetical protein
VPPGASAGLSPLQCSEGFAIALCVGIRPQLWQMVPVDVSHGAYMRARVTSLAAIPADLRASSTSGDWFHSAPINFTSSR